MDRPSRPLRPRMLAAFLAVGLVASACVTATRDDGPDDVEGAASPAPGASATASDADVSASPAASLDTLSSGPEATATLTDATPVAQAAEAPPTIGYIALDGSQWYVQAITTGVREASEAAGYELVECDSGADRAGVEACARELAEAGVDGFLSMQPFAGLAETVCTITGNVPVVGIVYDQGPCQVSLLQVDQVESGRLAGAALGALAADRWDCDVRSYVSLQSSAGDAIGAERIDGFRDGYQEHCKLPEDQKARNGAQFLVTAQTQMGKVLDRTPGKPIIVAAVTDLAALGALRAASDRDRQNQVWVAGQLADPAARQALACDRHYVASVAQLPERFGDLAVPALVAAIEGQEAPSSLAAELALVTSENVRELFPDTDSCDG